MRGVVGVDGGQLQGDMSISFIVERKQCLKKTPGFNAAGTSPRSSVFSLVFFNSVTVRSIYQAVMEVDDAGM